MEKLKSIFVAALVIMLPKALTAAPPAPELPTGACAGVIKSNSTVAHAASNVLSLAGTADEGLGELHASIYLDFDDSLGLESSTQQLVESRCSRGQLLYLTAALE